MDWAYAVKGEVKGQAVVFPVVPVDLEGFVALSLLSCKITFPGFPVIVMEWLEGDESGGAVTSG